MPLPEQKFDLPERKDQILSRPRHRIGFGEDFKRFFMRGLAAILPTLVTLWLLIWAWDFLWQNIGKFILNFIRIAWDDAIAQGWLPFQTRHYIITRLDDNDLSTRILGVGLSIVLVYIIGVFVGNLIGRAFWRVAERAVTRDCWAGSRRPGAIATARWHSPERLRPSNSPADPRWKFHRCPTGLPAPAPAGGSASARRLPLL